MKNWLILYLNLLISCSFINQESEQSIIPNHKIWDDLLQSHVNEFGEVNYKGMKSDSSILNQYLELLTNNPPNSKWSNNQELAYWINLYNAETVKLITKYYPIESIKDIGSKVQIPFFNTPWQIEFISINKKKYDLDDIEHNIIRKKFDEPRIHFALVCAAMSCPKLRNKAYKSENLNEQLDDQAKLFLADISKNQLKSAYIKLSKIFWWYEGDFKNKNSLIEFINRYSSVTIADNAQIDYMDYDWSLNAQ